MLLRNCESMNTQLVKFVSLAFPFQVLSTIMLVIILIQKNKVVTSFFLSDLR